MVADILDRVRRYASKGVTLSLPGGEASDSKSMHLSASELGMEIDRAHVVSFVTRALDARSPLRMAYERRVASDPKVTLRVPVPIRFDNDRAFRALLAIKEQVDKEAANAAIDMETRAVKPEQVGLRMDVDATLLSIRQAVARADNEAKLVADKLIPKMTSKQLADVKLDAVLGFFETRYSRSARARARTYNLRLAASRLDGTVVLPSETFDFNKTVGPRDEANGYRVAPVIAEGELVDGIGGGTCQISGTLHGAAFFAGLDVVERRPHSRPSSYIKLGMDAAVAYPTINFRIRNPFDFPVVLHQTVKAGVVRAEVLGPDRDRTVSFFRRIDEVIPFEVVERPTDKLATGERVLAQRGVPGFRVTIFRVVRRGAYAERSKRRDHYPPTTQIIRVGTGPEGLKSRYRDDKHLENVADEYLVMTQADGGGRRGAKRSMVESRTPGKTGRAGWQKKAGMPVYEPPEPEEEEKSEDEKG